MLCPATSAGINVFAWATHAAAAATAAVNVRQTKSMTTAYQPLPTAAVARSSIAKFQTSQNAFRPHVTASNAVLSSCSLTENPFLRGKS